MIRDYISHELQSASPQIKDLSQHEEDIRKAKNRQERNAAEGKARIAREDLLTALSPATTYEYLDVTHTANATEFRSAWQKENLLVEDCFQGLDKHWKGGRRYYQDLFASPKIDLAVLPPYSLFIQFTFTLAQPYISHDEQDFYIIDNPVRKDKIFGLPYIASTSWKGSLRAALWQLNYREKDASIRHLFGNDKDVIKDFQAGRLYFYPTFFTSKGLEIINRQDRKLRSGKDPIPFESVPAGTNGVFTLLSIPFDRVGQDAQETRTQTVTDLKIVAEGLQAMFRTHGFGAKTNSGFGLARESLQNALLEIRATEIPKPTKPLDGFDNLLTFAKELKQTLTGVPEEGQHEQ